MLDDGEVRARLEADATAAPGDAGSRERSLESATAGPDGDGAGDANGAPGARGGGDRRRLAIRGLLPLVLLAVFVVGFLRWGPIGVFEAAFPPVEELTIERVAFPEEGLIRVTVVNGGPEPVTLSQVMVDEAYWAFESSGDPTIDRLERRRVDIPYPWVDGEPHEIRLVTSTGLTFDAEVDVAALSPSPDARYITTFALLGVYVGVIPVFIGLLWFPFISGIRRRWVDFFLALTLGLLLFLGVDALVEAMETVGRVASAYQGTGLVLLGLVGTPLAIEAVGRLRRGGRSDGSGRGAATGYRLAFLVALGIGLHNLGEGLAIGTSYATGEIALGTSLVLGFLLHNTTEGVGIVAPMARERPGLARLALLGAVAGVPTILGAWIGGFSYSPVATVLFLSIGAGAVAQVVWVLGRMLAGGDGGGLAAPLNAAGVLAGMAIMFLTGMAVAA